MPYNLTTMQSIYHNQDEIVEITYNNSIVYQKSGPTPAYDIRYTTTDNQQLTLSSSTGVVSHTFENNNGYITLDSNKEVPASMFQYCTTLHKIYYSTGVTFDSSNGYQHDGCTSLDYVELPSDLVEIPPRCFRECESLCEMTVPSTVTTIGIFAWWKCGLNNHTSGHYQPDIKFTSITPAQNIDPDYTFSTNEENGYYTAQAHNTIYKLVPYEAWADYASDAKWRNTNNYIDWYDTDTTDYALLPFFVENTTDNAETVTVGISSGSGQSGTMSISDDGTTWTTLCTLPQSNFTFTLPAHTRKYIKTTCTSFGLYNSSNCITGADTIGGNVKTLCNGNADKTIIHGSGSEGAGLDSSFVTSSDGGNSTLVDARNLVLDYCDGNRSRLFRGATALKYAPKHWNTFEYTQANRTFEQATALTHAPVYYENGNFCKDIAWSHLRGASSLKAVKINDLTQTVGSFTSTDNFNYMMYYAESLVYVKCMLDPSNSILSAQQWNQFVNHVGSNGVFVKKAGTTWPTGNTGIPSNWTVLEATE